ncbi:response regulator [Nonomuraea recticatena]|uniref:Response regulatory domain-containing protein n=1 Tax=Nonomuraea recticatena TaxID=46178 RepID=A0ABN3S5T8_9ACTN
MPLKVLLAEDMRILREALAELLSQEDDLEVVASVPAGDEIVPAALAWRPDVAVIDIDLPSLDGISAAALLRERLPSCRSLILTAHHRG